MSTCRLCVAPWLALASCLLLGTAAVAATPPTAGDRLADNGNYAAAYTAFAAAQKATPHDVALLVKLVDVTAKLNQNKAAVAWARRAVAAAPNHAKYQLLLGDALGNYVDDVSMFRKLGIAHQVLAAYQQAVKLAPDNADARTHLAMFYILAPGIAGGSTTKADAQLTLLATEHPVAADLARADQAFGNKQYAAAEALYRRAAASAKDSRGDLALGNFFVRRKQPSDALAVFRKTIATFPHDPVAYYAIGRFASEGKAPAAEGIRDLTTYLGLAIDWQNGDPTYNFAHFRLGQIEARAGNTAKAKAEYQAALQVDPGFKPAQQALAKLTAS